MVDIRALSTTIARCKYRSRVRRSRGHHHTGSRLLTNLLYTAFASPDRRGIWSLYDQSGKLSRCDYRETSCWKGRRGTSSRCDQRGKSNHHDQRLTLSWYDHRAKSNRFDQHGKWTRYDQGGKWNWYDQVELVLSAEC